MTNIDPASATPPIVDVAKETWVKPAAVPAKVQDVTENTVDTGGNADIHSACSS